MHWRTGVQALFDPFDSIMLDVELRAADARRYALARLVQHLRCPLEWKATAARGLAREVSGRWATSHGFQPPFGWRMERLPDRDVYLLMPAWLVWLRLTRWPWSWLCRHAVRWGFLQGAEGGYFADMRWSLRVWNGSYGRAWAKPQHTVAPARWYRFWNRMHDDWCKRMPTWSS